MLDSDDAVAKNLISSVVFKDVVGTKFVIGYTSVYNKQKFVRITRNILSEKNVCRLILGSSSTAFFVGPVWTVFPPVTA